jgi:hypothetical protein
MERDCVLADLKAHEREIRAAGVRGLSLFGSVGVLRRRARIGRRRSAGVKQEIPKIHFPFLLVLALLISP